MKTIDRFEKITRIRTAPRAVLFRSGSDLLEEGHCSRGGLAMTTPHASSLALRAAQHPVSLRQIG